MTPGRSRADKPLAVVAVGGHAFTSDNCSNAIDEFRERAAELAADMMTLVERDYNLVVTHGNGPQIGQLLYQTELTREKISPMPLDVLVAQTEGSIGYLLQQALLNELRRRQIRRFVVTMISQVLVDARDSAFNNPTKPVGEFLTEEVAKRRQQQLGWQIAQGKRGWRRVVPSPQPERVIQQDMVRDTALHGHIVIAGGGGGVPVVKEPSEDYAGVEAVVDKDLTASILAAAIGAEVLIILTGVPSVFVNFGKEDQKALGAVTMEEIERLMDEGHFPPGSMGPKIQAIDDFLRAGGRRGVITDSANLDAALEGRAGTHFVGRL